MVGKSEEEIREYIKNLRWYASYANNKDGEVMYDAADIIEHIFNELKDIKPCNIGDELFKIIDNPWFEDAKGIAMFKVTGISIYEERSLSDKRKIIKKLLFQEGYNDAFAYFSDIGDTLFYKREDAINNIHEMGYCKEVNDGQFLVYKK